MQSNDLYQELKQHGLVLSEGTQIQLPPIQPPKPTLLSSLASYIIPQQPRIAFQQYRLCLVPILNQCMIIGRSNTLIYYKYQVSQDSSHQLTITRQYLTHLKQKIQRIHICDPKFLTDRGEIAFTVQASNMLTVFYVDLKGNTILQGNTISFTKIQSVRFICQKQLIVVSSSAHKYYIHHCFIFNGKIKQRSKTFLQFDKDIQKLQTLLQIDITGNIDQEQQSTICLFYLSVLKDHKEKTKSIEQQLFASNSTSQVFRVKEFQRDLTGNLYPKNTYKVLSTKNHNLLPQNYQIISHQKFFCITGPQQIIFIKKKFDRYLVIDNIVEKLGSNSLKFHHRGFVTSQNALSMQLNIVQLSDPKCTNRMLDSIEIPAELAPGFLLLWPFKVDKETSLVFVFQKEKKLVFCNLIKMNPIEKMLFVVQNAPKQKIPMIQQIAVNLGITKKDFYLNQWLHSKRQQPEIHQFLLPCNDIATIKKQLRSTLRKKKLQVSKFVQILQKISRIIKSQLQQNLSQFLFSEYIKNEFLLRKIKLKHADWRLDYRELDRIYNNSLVDMFVQIVKSDLYPEQQQKDPLHMMVEATVKEKMELKHVFQMFRIPILQNYTSFLIKFVSSFTADQIVEVFEKYFYLLPIYEFNPDLVMMSPEYETEVELKEKMKQKLKENPNIQEQQFSNISSLEFWRQMSKQRLQNELHNFYATSKISEAIKMLCRSDFGIKFKLQKHSLITCTIEDYKQKLKDISGIKLYLKLCQRVNQQNLSQFEESFNLSRQLTEIFKKNNNLTGKAYQTVRLYSSLHRFMLQHNFFEKKSMTTDELVLLRDQDLVALFFLQNKQRKQFIFSQFRDIFVQLYHGVNQFNQVIKKFIESENCSRIQLEIFIHQIKSKPKQFQDQNQQLIEIIIDGFCKKLQLREQNDTQRFIDIMVEMPLIKRLNLKIRKMLSIRECLDVFVIFKCQKESYFKILTLQENNEIFRLLLDRFFSNEIRSHSIQIDEDIISLEFCRNMLTVLFYLQEYIYYDVSQKNLLLTYCQVLVEWKQYEVIYGIIHEEGILQEFGIDVSSFIDNLVEISLTKIYTDQQIQFTSQTKQHITNILHIYRQKNNLIKTRQSAKLHLAHIFQQWGTNLHTHDIHLVVTEWHQGKKEVFLKDLINSYINNLSFQTFMTLYKYLQTAAYGQFNEQNLSNLLQANQQFISFSLYFAQRLMAQKQYNQITHILAYVKSQSQTPISYSLISQTFIKCLSQKYPSQQTIESGKQAIEYFTQYFDYPDEVKRIFESSLDAAQFQYMSLEKSEKIVVDEAFCFRKEYVQIEIELLWEIVNELYTQNHREVQMLYYSYYFLLMIFRFPSDGFKTNRISYSLQTLTDIMFRLQQKIDSITSLWHINIYSLFKKFLRTLYLEGLTRIKQVNPELFHSQFTQHADQQHLEMIKSRLKEDREKNLELLKAVSRVQQYIAQYKAVRKMEKQTKLERSILEEEKQKELKQRQQRVNAELLKLQQENKSNNQVQDQQKITISLKKFNYLRSNISFQSTFSNIITEKEIAQKIYQLEVQEKKMTQKKIPQNSGDFFKKLNQHEKLTKLNQHEKLTKLNTKISIQLNLNTQHNQQVQIQPFNFMQLLQQGMKQKFNPQQQIPPPYMYQAINHPFPSSPHHSLINPFTYLPQSPPFHPLYEDPLQQRINQIHQVIRSQQWDLLQKEFRREELTIATQRLFYSHKYSFGQMIKLMAKLSVIDERKLSVCLASNMYLENSQYLTLNDDQLKRIYPFHYLITLSTHFHYEFTQRMFRVMMEGFMPLAQTKPTFFLIEFANYIGHVIGDDWYTGHFLVEVLVPLLKGTVHPEILSRISLIFNHLIDFPHQVKYHSMFIKTAFEANPQNYHLLEQYYLKFLAILEELDNSLTHQRAQSNSRSHDAALVNKLMID